MAEVRAGGNECGYSDMRRTDCAGICVMRLVGAFPCLGRAMRAEQVDCSKS